jgi:hypothetical protein
MAWGDGDGPATARYAILRLEGPQPSARDRRDHGTAAAMPGDAKSPSFTLLPFAALDESEAVHEVLRDGT